LGRSKVLIVEDDPDVRLLLSTMLERAGIEPMTARDGRQGLRAFFDGRPDAVVLDVALPELDGWAVLERIRELSDVPVMVLTASAGEMTKVRGLRAGADDYVTKPFGAEELLARIRATLRRIENPLAPSEPIVRGSLVIDRQRFRVVRDGEEVRLTPKEFELLTLLAQYPGRVLTHRAILKAIWGPHAVDQPEQLRVLIGALRRKIERNPSAPRFILTEPWVGYRFADV
jgi:two-component system KDP operon response regulator KdpE